MDTWTRGLAVDFGFHNPTGVVFVGMNYDGDWYVYDEIYKSGMVTEETAKAIQDKMGGKHFTYKIGDSNQSQEIANLQTKGIILEAVKKAGVGQKSSIAGGITLINDMLKIQGNGRPKLFISEQCKNLIYEFETYHYPEDTYDRNNPEDPVKDKDHLLDALRYLRLKLYYGNPNLKINKPQNMMSRKYRK